MVKLVRSLERLLTRREADIARLVAAGLSNKQIARKASISEGTVKIHLHNAYKKLGIGNRSMLAVMISSGVPPTSDRADLAMRAVVFGLGTYPDRSTLNVGPAGAATD
jgi:DNA-binding CsgD family transcriptional regulator